MDKDRYAATAAKKTGDSSLEMPNASADNNERLSYLSQKARSMSLYGSQFLQEARSPTHALFCLSETNPLRELSKSIVVSKVFEYFILLAIGANCIVLALNTPLPKNDRTDMAQQLEAAEYYFVGIFCVEALLKIMAFGFVLHPGSYLRNGWNILDFTVVVVGVISLPPVSKFLGGNGTLDVKALRAVRVLRPLKLISGVPSLQVVMKSIVRAMVPLLQIALLVLFCILIYAIIGLEFLKDKFHTTCFDKKTNSIASNPEPCDKGPFPGVRKIFRGRRCPEEMTCREYWIGPNAGITLFDNIALSMLTVFQCITMEGWTSIMYKTFDAMDEDGYLYACYYVSLIVIGSFFVLNLVLGVLSGEFAKERERVDTRRKFFKVRRQQQLNRQVDAYLSWIAKAAETAADDNFRTKHLSLNDSQSQLVTSDVVSNPGRVVTRREGNCYRVNMPESTGALQRFLQWNSKFSVKVGRMVKTQAFYWTVLVCVFLNTIVLAVEYYGQPKWLSDFQAWAEIVFLTLFFAEMILKIYGLGFHVYFNSSFNCFDCSIVISGFLDIILSKTVLVKLGISVLRCVRLLRVFKMTRHWRSLRNLATSLVSSIKSIVSLIFLLFLFILIAALLGMQIFGGRFSDDETPTTNFDNFQNAMLAVFQILTGEDWNSVMYSGVKAHGGPHEASGIAASLYFVLLVILGNYTLLNVFLAIAVDNLANAQILTEDEENEKLERERARAANKKKYQPSNKGWGKAGNKLPMIMAINRMVRKRNGNAATSTGEGNSTTIENGETSVPPMSSSLKRKIKTYRREASLYENKEERNGTDAAKLKETPGTSSDAGEKNHKTRRIKRGKNEANGDTEREDDDDEDEDDPPVSRRNIIKMLKTGGRFGNRRRNPRKKKPILKTKTLFIFGPENRLRRQCHRIVNLRHFDNFMLVVILLSSITIAIEDPVNDDAKLNKVLMYFDYVFTGIFALEVLIKVVDVGIILHKGAYFRDWWNIIDALVVSFNMASLILEQTDSSGSGHSLIKALRVFRVLRPFKGVHKIKKLQAVFRCMWYSVKNVANILMITMLFLFIFAVMGVQLFKGKFQYCNDTSKRTKEECQGYFFVFKYDELYQQETVEKVENRTWENKLLNFDNVLQAMLTLYTSSTGEGWPSAMKTTMDTTEIDKGPIHNYSPGYALYYIAFVVVFSFFFLNIFVALIILTFQEEGEREIASCELDRNQRDCIQFALTAKPAQRYMPADHKSLQYKVWVIVMSKPFDTFILVLIALNTGVLMSQHYKQDEQYTDILMYLNIAFTVLYMIEAGLKFFALRLKYFRDYWNIFDFIVVLGGLMDVLVTVYDKFAKETQQEGGSLDIGIDPSMFRLFRAARLIKLLRRGYTIRILLWTFLQSFKALPYVTLLIMLMFFMYAVIGMQLFGKIALDQSTEINTKNNFRNLPQALQVLFRSATGEDWHKIMLACYDVAKCDKSVDIKKYGEHCGTTAGAIIFFCTFIFLCMFLMLNLFVAVIMDNFEYLTRDESILGPHHLDEFVRVWSEFDPGASGCIHHSEIYRVMCSMSPPVGFGKKCPKIVGYKRLIKMNMPLNDDNTVSFSTTLFALIRTSLNIKLRGNMNANDTELRRMIKRVWPKTSQKVLNSLIPKQLELSCQQMTIGKIHCAKLIHENYKYLKRKGTQTERAEREEERSTTNLKRGLFSKLVGSLRRQRRPNMIREDIELGNVERRRERAYTSDARLTMARPLPKEHVRRYSSLDPTSKSNGDVNKNGPQTYPDSSRGVVGASVPCSVTTPRVAERLRDQAALPALYLTPTTRRNEKGDLALMEGKSLDLDSSSDSDTGVEVDQDRPHLRRDPYYDDMITRINTHLKEAVEQGASPYAIYGLEDDDADDWC
nr:voltage-dependent N-type calcium channel subunit alpha-1B-like isoform X1 [Pocillopora verrucosa]XP_058951236.1 voltage-dependent N-type calcium channel subunit alpha-1B-like isoform X1 [Pocillopora verrucosa]XP_058951237.1 voltage-dependent N-type calcium channel subunit alpha-1B-like isoform X1 [Pocillopora verrucosa]XP_058951238.1 voltage-dependent N-type calcium channel subunit alpha-1B-like isoform X1 [Pocillopora verrucosa]